MTIKEISELSGISTRQVTRIGKELFPHNFQNGKKTFFLENEAIELMRVLRKKGFIEPRQNDKVPRQNDKVDAQMIALIVSETIKQLLPVLGIRQEPQPLALPELPPVNTRSELNSIIRSYAERNKLAFPEAWNQFYERVYYRLHMNIRVLASNVNESPLDYAEKNNLMGMFYALALAEFSK